MDTKKIEVVYASNIKFSQIWFRSVALSLILWVAPYLFGKYTDTSFPYIAKDDIMQELVGCVGPLENGLEWCPVVSPHLQGQNSLMTNDVEVVPEEEIVKKNDILEGGSWKPQECQSRYQVSKSSMLLCFFIHLVTPIQKPHLFQDCLFLLMACDFYLLFFQVAIIVPFRNRSRNLQQFLSHMHPFLTRQQLNYRYP